MKYKNLYGIEPEKLQKSMAGDTGDRTEAILGAALNEGFDFAKEFVLIGLKDGDPLVRDAAITAIGHLFRRFKGPEIIELRRELEEFAVGLRRSMEKIENSIEDYEIYQK